MNKSTDTKFKSLTRFIYSSNSMSLFTNLVALICIIVGYVIPAYGNILTSAGYFAFSGAITNWLAVYMLFEKVPLLYGSGIIPLRFEEFKLGIKNLILEQFFTDKNIERFLSSDSSKEVIKEKTNSLDLEKIFNNLVDAIMESPFGQTISLIGGRQALQPLKEPIITKLQQTIVEVIEQDMPISHNNHAAVALRGQIEQIVVERLNELSPQAVKEIIQDMIQKHLGWLVVWGGIFGGLIGAVVSLVEYIY